MSSRLRLGDVLRDRWYALEVRDRHAVVLGAIVLGAVLAATGWLELREARIRALEALHEQRSLQAWLEEAAAEASRLRRAGAGAHATTRFASPAQAMARVEEAARATGIARAVRALRPAGGTALEVKVEDASYAGLLRWLSRIGAGGLEVSRLSLTRRGPGRVDGVVVLAFGETS